MERVNRPIRGSGRFCGDNSVMNSATLTELPPEAGTLLE
jgi:hypothetical protein